MNCGKAISRLASFADSPFPGSVARHLQSCESCRAFADALREAPAGFAEPDRVELIKSLLFRDLRPVKPLLSERALFAVLLLKLSAVLVIDAGVLGIHGWLSLAPLIRTVIFGALLFGLCMLALAVVRQMVPATRSVVSPLVGALLAGGAAGGVLAGFVAMAGLEILCPNPNLAHILVWHLSIVVLGLMGGWTLGIAAASLRGSSRSLRSHL